MPTAIKRKSRAVVKTNKPGKPTFLAFSVEFEDGGQDFAWFDIKGTFVIGCYPFQAGVWEGRQVVNWEMPKVGGFLEITAAKCKDGKLPDLMTIKYPIKQVRALFDHPYRKMAIARKLDKL